MDSDDMMSGVLRRITTLPSTPQRYNQIYKHDADSTLLPHLEKLQENIIDFKNISEATPENVSGVALLDNIKNIIEYYIDHNFQIRYDFSFKIVYISNFNNELGNKLVEKLFLSFKRFFSYFDKQAEFFISFRRGMNTEQNARDNYIDLNIRDTSIELCDKIITNINKLIEHIKHEFPQTPNIAKGRTRRKKYRIRCPNGTRKNKKTGKCKKKKSKKSTVNNKKYH